MLWRRSASLMRTTPMSSTMARNILRRFSACCVFLPRAGALAVVGCPGDATELGDPIDELRHPLTELGLDPLERDRRVFDHVVEQGPGDRFGVELHPGQDRGHGNRVQDVGLARLAHVRAVRLDREVGGPFDRVRCWRRANAALPMVSSSESSACAESAAGSAVVAAVAGSGPDASGQPMTGRAGARSGASRASEEPWWAKLSEVNPRVRGRVEQRKL